MSVDVLDNYDCLSLKELQKPSKWSFFSNLFWSHVTFIKVIVHPKWKVSLFCHCLPPVVVFSFCYQEWKMCLSLFFCWIGTELFKSSNFGIYWKKSQTSCFIFELDVPLVENKAWTTDVLNFFVIVRNPVGKRPFTDLIFYLHYSRMANSCSVSTTKTTPAHANTWA